MDAVLAQAQGLSEQLLEPISPLLDAVAENTAVIDAHMDALSATVGLPTDQVKYILCLLAAVPFGWFLRALPNVPALKHFLSIFVSVLFSSFALGGLSWVHAVASAFGAYLLMLVLPPATAAPAVMVWAMTYMSVSHIYRMWTDYMGWTLDFTGPQMMLTLKLTSLAYCYADAHTKRDKDLYREQKKNEVDALPGLLEFYGFVFFFPSFLAGPSIEFASYRAFINMDMFKAEEGGKVPSTIVPTLYAVARAFFILPIVIMTLKFFPLDYLLSAEFQASPLWERLLRGWIHTMLLRFRYYFGWYLAECAFVACGADYNGRDKNGNIRWDLVRNCYPMKVEFGLNTKSVTDNWNICTALWLRNYVYFRLLSFGRGVATLGTYLLSAFWHGFYPGYYLFFVMSAFQTLGAQEFRKRFRPYFVKTTVVVVEGAEKKFERPRNGKWLYDFVGMVGTVFAASSNGALFVLLGWERASTFLYSVYFIPPIATVFLYVGMLALNGMFPPRRGKSSAKGGAKKPKKE
eukprot:TRINITY_DN4495_c0_g1_i1.p1 TRINITY_DN4495_c0_g1~~TRINITY_DN4495_c0_g1_i1.p1  ORF type:complete len:546 (+),score=169.85 TRINITY_DN4495_c0_g1_i1:87-1640(+)